MARADGLQKACRGAPTSHCKWVLRQLAASKHPNGFDRISLTSTGPPGRQQSGSQARASTDKLARAWAVGVALADEFWASCGAAVAQPEAVPTRAGGSGASAQEGAVAASAVRLATGPTRDVEHKVVLPDPWGSEADSLSEPEDLLVPAGDLVQSCWPLPPDWEC
jgi:hypothetical protein